ncbi:MAG TPA: DUF2007 domain-containing protein [Thermoanaerobaculia bacterium]|nr:DUF2007 domain-containing protein [Thermoanaerobaculia bacterium]
MPYCPKCREEFRDEITECPEDKVPLVEELPYQAVPAEGTTWVEIASTGTDDEARLLQGFLQSEGIETSIENVKFTMEPVNFGDMSDIRIYVSAEDEEQALKLLRERDEEYRQLNDEDDTLVTDDGVAEIEEDEQTEPE